MNLPPAPLWPWQKVLSQRIEAVHSTWDGVEGADYRVVGIELENRIVLNLSLPHELYHIDSTTVHASFNHEFENVKLTSEQLAGRTLRALLYVSYVAGHFLHLAILDDGTYLLTHPGFYDTDFTFACFDEWKPDSRSHPLDGHGGFLTLQFFNAWTHERVNPFAIQWKACEPIEVSYSPKERRL